MHSTWGSLVRRSSMQVASVGQARSSQTVRAAGRFGSCLEFAEVVSCFFAYRFSQPHASCLKNGMRSSILLLQSLHETP